MAIEHCGPLGQPAGRQHRIAVGLGKNGARAELDEVDHRGRRRPEHGLKEARRGGDVADMLLQPLAGPVDRPVIVDEQLVDVVPIGVGEQRRKSLLGEFQPIPGQVQQIDAARIAPVLLAPLFPEQLLIALV